MNVIKNELIALQSWPTLVPRDFVLTPVTSEAKRTGTQILGDIARIYSTQSTIETWVLTGTDWYLTSISSPIASASECGEI